MENQQSHHKHSTQVEEPLEPGSEPIPEVASDELALLKETLLKAEAERDSYKDQLLRALADFQNFRKRVEADKVSIRATAKEGLVVGLIDVLDNFERTVAALDSGATVESVLEGIKMVDRQLNQFLEANGVTKISSSGQPFDPELHEAISIEVTDEHPSDTITHELSSGYKLADKVIRPARVKVSKKP